MERFGEGLARLARLLALPPALVNASAPAVPRHHDVKGGLLGAAKEAEVRRLCPNRSRCEELVRRRGAHDHALYARVEEARGLYYDRLRQRRVRLPAGACGAGGAVASSDFGAFLDGLVGTFGSRHHGMGRLLQIACARWSRAGCRAPPRCAAQEDPVPLAAKHPA
jgi:hypothetical protein